MVFYHPAFWRIHSRTHSYTRMQRHILTLHQYLELFHKLTLFMCFFLSQTLYRDRLTWRHPICSETGWIRIPPWLHWSPSPRAPRQVRHRWGTMLIFSCYHPLVQDYLLKSFPPASCALFSHFSSSSHSFSAPLCIWNVWSAVSPLLTSSGRRERERQRTKLPGTESWKCAYLLNEACYHSNISLICTMTAVMTQRGLPWV